MVLESNSNHGKECTRGSFFLINRKKDLLLIDFSLRLHCKSLVVHNRDNIFTLFARTQGLTAQIPALLFSCFILAEVGPMGSSTVRFLIGLRYFLKTHKQFAILRKEEAKKRKSKENKKKRERKETEKRKKRKRQ